VAAVAGTGGVAAVWSARLTLGAIPGLQIGTRQVVFDAYVIAVALVLAASIGQRSPRFFALRA
jgi:hypothetical protein